MLRCSRSFELPVNLVKLAERLIETLILNKTSEFLKAADKHHKEGTFLCIPLLPSPVAAIGLFQDPGEAQDLKMLLQGIRRGGENSKLGTIQAQVNARSPHIWQEQQH